MHNKRNLYEVGGAYTQWEGSTWEKPMHRGIKMHWDEYVWEEWERSKHSGKSLSERCLCTGESIGSGKSLYIVGGD